MKANKNGEINFKISEKLLPGFSNVQEKRFVSIIGLAKNNKIAFVRIQEKNRSWELPGGAILEEESIIKAAEREKAAALKKAEAEQAKKDRAKKSAFKKVGSSAAGTVGREFGKQAGNAIGGKFGKTLGGNVGAALGRGLLDTLFKM